MNLMLLFFGFSTLWLFMFKIDWLFKLNNYLINLGYDLVLFAASLIMINNKIGDPKFVVALKMPLMSSLVFWFLYVGFKKIYKCNPKNTFWTFTKKPVADIVFSGLFWFLGVILPLIVAL